MASGCYTITMNGTKIKKLILAITAAAGLNTAGFAGDFSLNSVSASDLKASLETLQAAPAPAFAGSDALNKSPNLPSRDLDMTIRLPFKDMNSRIVAMCDDIKVIDPALPVLSRQGDHLVFTNVTVTYRGIATEPTVLLKPVFEGNNRLAVKFLKVDVDMAFGPNKDLDMTNLNKDDLMSFVTESLTKNMLLSMDEALKTNKAAFKAKDMISFAYDKASWNLRAAVDPGFVAPLLPGLLKNIYFTSFDFDATGFSLRVKSGPEASMAQLPGYNLAMSDGLLDNFMLQFTNGTDFEFHPKAREGGLKFRGDGRIELAGKIYARDVFLKPNVYFTAIMLPRLTAPNTIRLTIERVDVDQAYGIGLPGFINNWVQGTATASVIETITKTPALAKVMSARKLNDKTVELVLKNSAFLPSFASGTVIKSMKVGNGLIYLGFQL